MKHTKLLSIVEDILNEGKNVWRQPPRGKYRTKHTQNVKSKRCQVNCKNTLQSKALMGPAYGVEVEATDAFHKKV